MFRTTGQVGANAGRCQRLAQFGQRLADKRFAIAAALVKQLGDAPVDVRLQEAEGQILQLPFQLPDTESVGQRRVDVAGQPRQRVPLPGRQLDRRAHPRQLPRQQNEHHAQIAHDRQQQTTQTFRRLVRGVLGVQRPHLFGRLLALDQPLQLGRQGGALRFPYLRRDARQFEPQRRRLGLRIAAQQVEQVQHVAAFGFGQVLRRAGVQRGRHRGRQLAGAIAPLLQAGRCYGWRHERISP